MKKSVVLAILITVVVAYAQAQNSETRSLDNFNAIGVGEAIKLVLIPGNKNEAIVTASNIDLEDIETRVSGSKLKIELNGNNHRNTEVEIMLTYKSLKDISVSSAADVTTKGVIKADEFEVSVSSAGYANLTIDVNTVEISVSSSGSLVLEGNTKSQRVGVSSAGEYKGYDLDCEEAYVKASSAGSAKITANQKIDARASSAGSVKYKGNPAKVYVDASSGGSTSKTN